MRNSNLLGVCSAVAAVAVAGTANAAIVIDNFTQAQTAITTWNYSGNGAVVDGVGPTDLTFGSPGSGILGNRLISTNTWGNLDPLAGAVTTASATMNGNGQLAVSLFGGDSADNQLMSQYRFASAIDMTQAANSQIRIAGSGSASGGGDGYGIGIVLFSNLRFANDVQIGWQPNPTDPEGDDLPLYGPGIGYDGRFSTQITMSGSRSLGEFVFNVADFVPAAMLSSINGMQVFQYAYGGDGADAGIWNYTATSFSIVPAPGALALLGAAGMVSMRRRKA